MPETPSIGRYAAPADVGVAFANLLADVLAYTDEALASPWTLVDENEVSSGSTGAGSFAFIVEHADGYRVWFKRGGTAGAPLDEYAVAVDPEGIIADADGTPTGDPSPSWSGFITSVSIDLALVHGDYRTWVADNAFGLLWWSLASAAPNQVEEFTLAGRAIRPNSTDWRDNDIDGLAILSGFPLFTGMSGFGWFTMDTGTGRNLFRIDAGAGAGVGWQDGGLIAAYDVLWSDPLLGGKRTPMPMYLGDSFGAPPIWAVFRYGAMFWNAGNAGGSPAGASLPGTIFDDGVRRYMILGEQQTAQYFHAIQWDGAP